MATERSTQLRRVVLGTALACALGFVLVFGSCMDAGEQRVGQGLGGLATGNARDYKYVGDMHRRLYWVNTPENRRRVPADSRVYISDDETLSRFAGYTAGD